MVTGAAGRRGGERRTGERGEGRGSVTFDDATAWLLSAYAGRAVGQDLTVDRGDGRPAGGRVSRGSPSPRWPVHILHSMKGTSSTCWQEITSPAKRTLGGARAPPRPHRRATWHTTAACRQAYHCGAPLCDTVVRRGEASPHSMSFRSEGPAARPAEAFVGRHVRVPYRAQRFASLEYISVRAAAGLASSSCRTNAQARVQRRDEATSLGISRSSQTQPSSPSGDTNVAKLDGIAGVGGEC
jgi:hypothetical protein